MRPRVDEVAAGVFRVRDTCNVYVVLAPRAADGEQTAIAIDFGSGLVLDVLDDLGVDRLTDVLMTHHHRDQGQGLHRAVAAGIAVHVPPVEHDLFAHVDEMWAARTLSLDYNLRQDRFSLLEPVPVASTVPEYRTHDFHGVSVRTWPTPGHTMGSVTYIVEAGGRRIAFTGDLIYAPGKVWSLASTQWSYTENEGPAMTVLSCYLLLREHLQLLLPSHGEPMHEPVGALELLAERMQRYVDQRRPYPWALRARLRDPYIRLTEHLLLNRSSMSCSYVLLSDTGGALVIDLGYDMTTGLPAGYDRASRRPWLPSFAALRDRFGVRRVEVALPTHYHDDHVAGLNLLRDVEGTQVWTPENVAPILADPTRYDLPCLWFDPIPSDRVLALGQTFTWQEYEITVHELPGHTLYAAAYELEVDGVKVLVTGDQQDGLGVPGERREILNYQYRNRFRVGDYRRSADLYRRVGPGLMVSGHWEPRWVDEAYLDMLQQEADELVEIHSELLPLDEVDSRDGETYVWVIPYRAHVRAGQTARFAVEVRNPLTRAARAQVRPVLPEGWTAEPAAAEVELDPSGRAVLQLDVCAAGGPLRRARLAVDVTIGDLRLGQHAEALIDVAPAGPPGAGPDEYAPAEEPTDGTGQYPPPRTAAPSDAAPAPVPTEAASARR